MKSIMDFIYESMSIDEARTSLSLKNKDVISAVSKYLETYFKESNGAPYKCVICDDAAVDAVSAYPGIKERLLNPNEVGPDKPAWFYIKMTKNNFQFFIYQTFLSEISDMFQQKGIFIDPNDRNIYHIEPLEQLLGRSVNISLTSKSYSKKKVNFKIYPDGVWETQSFVSFDDNNPPQQKFDFRTQDALVITRDMFGSFLDVMAESLSKELGEGNILAQLFASGKPFEFLNEHKDDTDIRNAFACGISEPLCIYGVMTNHNGCNDELKANNKSVGKIMFIVVPLKQNWPIADFYVKYENLDTPIAVSVKSSGPGNRSTILPCLKLDKQKGGSSKGMDELMASILPQLNSTKRWSVDEKLANGCADYILTRLEENYENRKGRVGTCIVQTLKDIADVCKDEDIKEQLQQLIGANGENIGERIITKILNASDSALKRIKTAVVLATTCYKMTIYSDGRIKTIAQSEDGNISLEARGGGISVDITYDGDRIADARVRNVTKQGQFFGYTFK